MIELNSILHNLKGGFFMSLTDRMLTRKSVRTFDTAKTLDDATLTKLKECMDSITNPYNIPIRFQIIKKDDALTSPVLVGEEYYVTASVIKQPHFEEAYGYSFQLLMLAAAEMGLGTVMIGGTMKREAFEAASNLADGELMPCMTPIGYPAPKLGIKEALMRKGVKADSRKDFNELFFEGQWDTPISDMSDDVKDALEHTRWAPSAVNKQPWRIVKQGNSFHFYEKKDKGYDNPVTGDLQKVDLGIALCNFITYFKERGTDTSLTFENPGISIPENTDYIATVTI